MLLWTGVSEKLYRLQHKENAAGSPALLLQEVSDDISSHSPLMRLVSVAALLRHCSPSPHPLLRLHLHKPEIQRPPRLTVRGLPFKHLNGKMKWGEMRSTKYSSFSSVLFTSSEQWQILLFHAPSLSRQLHALGVPRYKAHRKNLPIKPVPVNPHRPHPRVGSPKLWGHLNVLRKF